MKDSKHDILKEVANRNIELYKKDKEHFEARMFLGGWNQSEVEHMEKYLETVN